MGGILSLRKLTSRTKQDWEGFVETGRKKKILTTKIVSFRRQRLIHKGGGNNTRKRVVTVEQPRNKLLDERNKETGILTKN